jgi:hypothetical protein
MRIKKYKSFNESKNNKIINDFVARHLDKYDYSKVNYINSRTNVDIICPIHGVFSQNPYSHKMGSNCPSCSGNKKGNKESFIKLAKSKHGNLYDYSKVNYVDNKTKVDIICPVHGVFRQTPNMHIVRVSKCPKCSGRNKNTDNFIEDAIKLHSNKYDYSNVIYKNAHSKVDIICPIHGTFSMSYNSHITKVYGCPNCIETSGESYIINFLKSHNILFEYQKKFNDCIYKRVLTFDFYLPTKNIILEYDGRQHFLPVWGGDEGLDIIRKRDKTKDNYCKDNNIHIIRIRYDEDIDLKLKEIL